MSATILCSFDDVDLAEIAVGRVRHKIPSIRSVEISRPYFGEASDNVEFFPMSAGMAAGLSTGMAGNVAGMSGMPGAAIPVYLDVSGGSESNGSQGSSDYIPRSVTLRITCESNLRDSVEAQLINLGALKIRSFNDGLPR